MFNKLSYYFFKRKHGSYWTYDEYYILQQYSSGIYIHPDKVKFYLPLNCFKKVALEYLKGITITKITDSEMVYYQKTYLLKNDILITEKYADLYLCFFEFGTDFNDKYGSFRFYDSTVIKSKYSKIELDTLLTISDSEIEDQIQVLRDDNLIMPNISFYDKGVTSGYIINHNQVTVCSKAKSLDVRIDGLIPRVGYVVYLDFAISKRTPDDKETLRHVIDNIKLLYPDWKITIEKRNNHSELIIYKNV